MYTLRRIYIASHVREGRHGDLSAEEVANQNQEFASEYDRLGAYADYLGLELSEPYCPVCYGGIFAAKVSQIRKKSAGTWDKLVGSLSRADNLIEGHFAERLWASLLVKPLTKEISGIIESQKKTVRCRARLKNYCGILALT